jgi:hypothetical protein
VDPGAIRPPASSDLRGRTRAAGKQAVATELPPARAVTAAGSAAGIRSSAAEGARAEVPAAPAAAPGSAGLVLIAAGGEADRHDPPVRRSALLRFRAYARPGADPAQTEPDMDLQL